MSEPEHTQEYTLYSCPCCYTDWVYPVCEVCGKTDLEPQTVRLLTPSPKEDA